MAATVKSPVSPASTRSGAGEKGLKRGALGLVASIVVGVASTAPAYSLAATLGLVVVVANGDGIVGVKAPSVMILAFVPIYFVAVAYAELNKAEPDCGTTFTWAARAFGPHAGWMGGWGIIAADVIVMANLAQIAGQYSFSLVGADGLAASALWTTVAGVVWILVMTAICYIGIEVSARLQYVLLSVEVLVLIAFSVFAVARVYGGSAPAGSLHPRIGWLIPSGLSLSSLVTAVLLAVFIYWGWDSAVACNEETREPAKTPGRAAIISTLLLLATYALVSIATVSFGGVGKKGLGLGNADNSADVFNALGSAVFGHSLLGRTLEVLLLVCVLTSASASTQTTILPTARTTLSMAAYRAMPARFAKVHPRFLTPSVSTVWMGAVSIVFYVGLTLVSTNVLADSVASIGLLIAFYYGLTGFACVWFFRRTITSSVRNFVMQGLFPLLGGISLLGAFCYACYLYAAPDYGYTSIRGVGSVFVIGVGSLLFGVLLMVLWNVADPAFFRGRTLGRSRGDLVLAGGEGPTYRLPDSGMDSTVIAPDLSNLPIGARAVDLSERPGGERR